MRKAQLSSLASFFLLSCQAMAQTQANTSQFVTKQVSLFGSCSLEIVDPNSNDIQSAWVYARVQNNAAAPYVRMTCDAFLPSEQKIAQLSTFDKEISTEAVLGDCSVGSTAQITSTSTLVSGSIFLSTKTTGHVNSKAAPGNNLAHMLFSRRYKVKLSTDASFGVLQVNLNSLLMSNLCETGIAGSSITNQTTGRTVSIDFDEIANSYEVTGCSVGFLPNAGTPADEEWSFVVQPTFNANGISISKSMTGYLLVHDGDIISVVSNAETNQRNSQANAYGYVMGNSSSLASLGVSLSSYSLTGTSNLKTFPMTSSMP